MTNDEKAAYYGKLLNEHTRLQNQASEIKGQSIDLNPEQIRQIQELEARQLKIMNEINRLLS
jgi:hypothetical protein